MLGSSVIPLSKNAANLRYARDIVEDSERADSVSWQGHGQRVCRVEQERACNRPKRPISRACPIRWMSCVDLRRLVGSNHAAWKYLNIWGPLRSVPGCWTKHGQGLLYTGGEFRRLAGEPILRPSPATGHDAEKLEV